ncbi:hypothetical protein NEOLEDRAFT_1243277 [Neolentinus lepideus HHB14362 ss-1]|uniref:DUF6534 domain-containing protein n=1 Tax=Neolentinus lepideus HHB14362 ss-1 TaxID=1314782 RepID=A0A165R423_9AGAM|nr:hypothetical protein NEOLEDRAFT_1243277 [Neolentinus lepideus HHB14362 ss-1]
MKFLIFHSTGPIYHWVISCLVSTSVCNTYIRVTPAQPIMNNELPASNITSLFIGFIVSTALYGVTCGQAICYQLKYSREDRLGMRILVVLLWFIDTVEQSFMMETMWYYLIYRCGRKPSCFHTANWSLIFHAVPTEIAVVIVQWIFVRRIWIVSEHKRSTYLFTLPIISGTGLAVAYVWKCYKLPAFQDAYKLEWIPVVVAACRTSTDISIAVSMYMLLKTRSGEMWKGSFMRVIADFTLITGIVTSVATAGYLVALIVKPSSLSYVGIYYVYGKLHVNTVLTGLNARGLLRDLAKEPFLMPSSKQRWQKIFTNPSSLIRSRSGLGLNAV